MNYTDKRKLPIVSLKEVIKLFSLWICGKHRFAGFNNKLSENVQKTENLVGDAWNLQLDGGDMNWFVEYHKENDNDDDGIAAMTLSVAEKLVVIVAEKTDSSDNTRVEEVADRLIACVNACAGFTTAQLKQMATRH